MLYFIFVVVNTSGRKSDNSVGRLWVDQGVPDVSAADRERSANGVKTFYTDPAWFRLDNVALTS